MTLHHRGGRAAGLELDAHLGADTYQAATAEGAFDLTEANRGEIFGGELQADQPVDVTLFLRHELLARCFSTPDAFALEVNRVLNAMASPDDILSKAEAWVFVSVMQDVPGYNFQIGFKHRSYEGLDEHLLL